MTDSDYDFGFSFADEAEALASANSAPQQTLASSDDLKVLQDKIDNILLGNEQLYKAKLKEVEGLILPLLYNLMKNPEKAYIKWENRTEVIKRQIDKIIAITRS